MFYYSSWLCVYDDLKKCICGVSLDMLYDVLPFLHGCVLKMIEEMGVWYLSTLFLWPQFVLAKNLSKGKIVGYLCIGFIIAKTNIHVRCWICCSNILASCTMLDMMFKHPCTDQCALFVWRGFREL